MGSEEGFLLLFFVLLYCLNFFLVGVYLYVIFMNLKYKIKKKSKFIGSFCLFEFYNFIGVKLNLINLIVMYFRYDCIYVC